MFEGIKMEPPTIAIIYLHNVYHKRPYISLHSLAISRQKWKTPSCFQLHCAMVAWNHFFILVFCKCSCKCKKMKLFPYLELALAFMVVYAFDVVHPCIFLHLHLHLCHMCEWGLCSIKTLEFKVHEELEIT